MGPGEIQSGSGEHRSPRGTRRSPRVRPRRDPSDRGVPGPSGAWRSRAGTRSRPGGDPSGCLSPQQRRPRRCGPVQPVESNSAADRAEADAYRDCPPTTTTPVAIAAPAPSSRTRTSALLTSARSTTHLTVEPRPEGREARPATSPPRRQPRRKPRAGDRTRRQRQRRPARARRRSAIVSHAQLLV